MFARITICLALLAEPLCAGSFSVSHPVSSNTILQENDLVILAATFPGTVTMMEDAVGLEARVNLYPGRPIRHGDLAPAAVIERNEIVSMSYSVGGLWISTDGRALERAGMGQTLRLMNIESRNIISGRVVSPGRVEVTR